MKDYWRYYSLLFYRFRLRQQHVTQTEEFVYSRTVSALSPYGRGRTCSSLIDVQINPYGLNTCPVKRTFWTLVKKRRWNTKFVHRISQMSIANVLPYVFNKLISLSKFENQSSVQSSPFFVINLVLVN